MLGSLTLGGYDDSLLVKHGVSFGFFYHQTRALMVLFEGATTNSTSVISLLPNGVPLVVDLTAALRSIRGLRVCLWA